MNIWASPVKGTVVCLFGFDVWNRVGARGYLWVVVSVCLMCALPCGDVRFDVLFDLRFDVRFDVRCVLAGWRVQRNFVDACVVWSTAQLSAMIVFVCLGSLCGAWLVPTDSVKAVL